MSNLQSLEQRMDRIDYQVISDDKDKRISDLEAKLAESEEQRKEAYKEGLLQKQFDKDAEIIQLKQQLAEKEKELGICRNQAIVDMQYKEFLELKLATIENVKNRVNCNVADNQDKISFAVVQLEKARTQFQTKYSWYEETHRVCEKIDDFVIWLDNQIKQLKEGK